MVAELLVVAELMQDSSASSQLAYRPGAGVSPAHQSFKSQAAVPTTTATTPPFSLTTSQHNGYDVGSTQGCAYYSTTNDTSCNPQYTSNIFLPRQQPPYINFSADTYSTTTEYAPVTTYALDQGFTDFTPAFDAKMEMFSPHPADFDFSDLSYLNVDSSYALDTGSNSMDYILPPQRNATPASYISISGPCSNQGSHKSRAHSQHSPTNSWVSSAAASHVATPPGHNGIVKNETSPAIGGSPFSTPEDPFASLYQNSQVDKLVSLSRLIGSGLDYIIDHGGEVTVVLLSWPLKVLQDTCGSYGTEKERLYCSNIRHKLQRKSEQTTRWVTTTKWRAVGAGATKEYY